jgi:predicted nucleic acid-binding protein
MNYRYWDAVTFVGWLAEEPDKVIDCRPVIEAAEAGTVTNVKPKDAIHLATALRHDVD